jgi:hypothetical protein
MSQLITCWFAVQFRMRAGQGGWLPPGSANVMHGKVTLTAHRTHSGTIHITKRIGRDEAMHGDTAEFVRRENDKKEIQAVDVTVPIALDTQRFEEGCIDDAEFERGLRAATEALLAKYPETRLWRKPDDRDEVRE